MQVLTVPDAVVLEPEHAQPAVVHEHVRHEEIVTLLHQEEVGAAIVYELGTMFRADLDDLGLSEAQVVQRFPDGQEELAVVSALG
jgi:hypothetical protein